MERVSDEQRKAMWANMGKGQKKGRFLTLDSGKKKLFPLSKRGKLLRVPSYEFGSQVENCGISPRSGQKFEENNPSLKVGLFNPDGSPRVIQFHSKENFDEFVATAKRNNVKVYPGARFEELVSKGQMANVEGKLDKKALAASLNGISLRELRGLRAFNAEIDRKDYEGIEGLRAEISEKDYNAMLEVLPPMDFSGSSFYMSEFLSGDLTTKFSKRDGKFFAEVVDYRKDRGVKDAPVNPGEVVWARRDQVKDMPMSQGYIVNRFLRFKNVKDVGYTHGGKIFILFDDKGKERIQVLQDKGSTLVDRPDAPLSIYEKKPKASLRVDKKAALAELKSNFLKNKSELVAARDGYLRALAVNLKNHEMDE